MNKNLVIRLASLLLSSSVVISSMGIFADTNVLGDGVALSPKSQIRQELMDLVVAQSEVVIAHIKSKQVQDNKYYTYSPVSKTITIKKDLELNELEMPKDFKKMIINAGVKIKLEDLKIEEVAVNEGASVTLENMQVNKLELLGNDLDKEQTEGKDALVTNVYLDKGSKVKNVILKTKTSLYAAADSQIEDIVIKREAKDCVLEIKNAKGMNIKSDNDLKLNGKNVDKNNVSQHLKDIVEQQAKTESDKTTSTGNNNGGGSTGGDNNIDDGNNGGSTGGDNNTDDGNNGGSTGGDNNTDDGNNGGNTGDDNNTDDGNNGGNTGDDNNTDDGNNGGNTGDDNNTDDGNNGGNTGDDNTGGDGDTENTTPDEKGTVQTVYDKLTDKFILGEKNSSLDNVQHAINLPWDLDGCDIYWEFSRPYVINYDGALQGLGAVGLTATISQGDESIEKKFNLIVREFIDLEDMRQALENMEFEKEISGDYVLPEYIGGYHVIYITNSTCVGELKGETYTLKPTGNGTAELLVIMSASGEEEITRTIQIKVNINGTTPPDTTTDTAIS